MDDRKNFDGASLTQQIRNVRNERDFYLNRLKQLNSIGIALSTERHPKKLFNMILQKSREITSSDAGSLFLVEGDEETGKHVRFKIMQNDSMETVAYEESVLPLSRTSIAGYVASTGTPLHIPDAYQIPPDSEYGFNRSYDRNTGYRTVSMLAIPMRNHKGETIGGMQLINRKRNFSAKLTRQNFLQEIQPFDKNDEELASSLASQAAVALENIFLIGNIETLFEGFVTAAVTAIESRDPTTSGHSFRVADLTVALAELVDKTEDGPFHNVRFTADEIKEIRYAGLLHDFGKVGVREHVLVKAKKLYPHQLDLLKERFRYIRKSWEADFYKSKLKSYLQNEAHPKGELEEFENANSDRLKSIDEYLAYILTMNEPELLVEANPEKLHEIRSRKDLFPPGEDVSLLTEEEVELLSIKTGSLNELERKEIESHVTHTYQFLSKIPWTSELKKIPQIAYGHHEKLNGTGYPNRFKADEIALQTRMMTIADTYDALAAADRPYKKAVPPEHALDIIAGEVKKGRVDGELFQLFLDAKIYQITQKK